MSHCERPCLFAVQLVTDLYHQEDGLLQISHSFNILGAADNTRDGDGLTRAELRSTLTRLLFKRGLYANTSHTYLGRGKVRDATVYINGMLKRFQSGQFEDCKQAFDLEQVDCRISDINDMTMTNLSVGDGVMVTTYVGERSEHTESGVPANTEDGSEDGLPPYTASDLPEYTGPEGSGIPQTPSAS